MCVLFVCIYIYILIYICIYMYKDYSQLLPKYVAPSQIQTEKDGEFSDFHCLFSTCDLKVLCCLSI